MKTTEINHSQQAKTQALEERNAVLEQQLDWFKRQLFGRKSEKQLLEEDSNQGQLFDLGKENGTTKTSTDIKAHQRKSNKQLNG